MEINSEEKSQAQIEKEKLKEKLKGLKPLDYRNINNNLEEWIKITEEIPEYFWGKLKDINQEMSLYDILNKIRKELYEIYGDKKDEAKSLADSRFTPLPTMIERGMVSCGSLTNIFGTVLRKIGIPLKFIHGILGEQVGKKGRHSWLEVYDPTNNSWFGIDITQGSFRIQAAAKKIKDYHDWTELKKDYDKGNY